MEFRTQIPIINSDNPINYSSKIMSLGSCFAENIGDKFQYFKFQITTNPFGIIFNPVSIEMLISRAVNNIQCSENDIFFHNDLWHCFEVHSELSHTDKETFLTNLNLKIQQSHNLIIQSTHIIITYGTSWVYRNKLSGKIVANCHKIPQNQFEKEILSKETIEKAIQNTIALVQKINPDCHFIFTISPVRHIKDGFVENNISKSHLIAAIHSSNFQLLTSSYFPSYEIMIDELRDYRFYAEDMLHPSQMAIDYIWQRFSETTISAESYSIMNEVEIIQKGLAHRPFNPDSASHQEFCKNLIKKMNTLASKFPKIQL